MSAQLRIAGLALPLAVVLVGAVVVAEADEGLLLPGALALAFLAVPALLIGAFVGAWAFDAAAKRRLGRWLVGMLAVQLAALAGLVVVLVAGSAPVAPSVVLVVLAVAQDPIAVLLGRAVRRREPPVAAADPDELREAIARARRRPLVGGSVGLVVGAAMAAAVSDPATGGAPAAVVLVAFFFVVGASVAASIARIRIARRIRALLGDGFGQAQRIGAVVAGGSGELSADEAMRAARYAAIAPAWFRLQLDGQMLGAVMPVLVLLAFSALGGSRDAGLLGLFGFAAVISMAGAVVAAVSTRRRARRIAAYSAVHPAVSA